MNDFTSRSNPMSSGTHGAAHRRKTVVRLAVLLLLALVLFGGVFAMKWFGNKMMVQYLENMPIPPATISAAEAQIMRWDNRLEAIGTLVPVQGADLTTEVGGVVEAIHFESGDRVEKGALLVTLDAQEQLGELKRLQAQAELAELNRKRREQLFKLEAISKADYDAAVAESNAARAAAEAQAGRVAQKQLRAPFAGVLGIRRINVGQYVAPGTPIVTLQSLDPIDIDFSLPEQYVGHVRPGYAVSVRVDAQPERVFEGRVLAVEPKIDTSTRNFGVRARLANADGVLRAGQFGRVALRLPGEREVLAIPRTAVNYSSYGTSVFVVQKKASATTAPAAGTAGQTPATDLEVVQRFVRIGESRGDFVAVLEGLKAGEQVATSGLIKLGNQHPVIINNSLAPKATLDPTPPQT
ncbi:membrane fusion protein, multidrug efflux system [Fontimonas thermophila]|uniref:Membrane fusion protein, multidrug efflux system n=1 Tax=Fontimonas thermophila TaxID=1076937 RepID=A0A1I2HAH4_9GAMM|nr:efflux RND transporter periplasmic adaptor subunit [Fontimonas thermophila]SFF27184.1 membrane fusion protein, multidrug efflux system [Fontimonas thermophila]